MKKENYVSADNKICKYVQVISCEGNKYWSYCKDNKIVKTKRKFKCLGYGGSKRTALLNLKARYDKVFGPFKYMSVSKDYMLVKHFVEGML